MSILEEIRDRETWETFYQYKEASRHTKKKELNTLRSFIDEERYRPITDALYFGTFPLSLPQKTYISKKGTNRKRVVYILPDNEKRILQILCYLMARYDKKFYPNSYAFRMNRSVKDAAYDIHKVPNIQKKFTVKIDIHDYFNSIPDAHLLTKIADFFEDDPPLRDFLLQFFGRKEVLLKNEVIRENHGAMAGTPLSGFMANVYLSELDGYFAQRGIPYFRYSDDIILFTDTEEERKAALTALLRQLTEAGLTVNPEKFQLTAPGEAWDYLGFSYIDGDYDISNGTILKTKRKIRRHAHYLYRKRSMKGWSYEDTVARFLRRFNKMFYDESEENEFCWKRWYFTFVTKSEGFRVIDEYMQQYLRYLYSGRHYKGNYRISYEKLKELGYRSLVAEYYKYKENR